MKLTSLTSTSRIKHVELLYSGSDSISSLLHKLALVLYAFTGIVGFAIPIYHGDMVSRRSHPKRFDSTLDGSDTLIMVNVER